jgi:hypothetical protein
VDRGRPGTLTTLRATKLPPSTEINLRWWTMVGNRIWRSGFGEESRPMGTLLTGPDGSGELTLAIPDDLGGQHRIEVLSADGSPLGSVGLVIEPLLESFGPVKLRAGEDVKIHLKGVGWTTYDNVYAVTYDNASMGYVCGFATNGDVRFEVTATGEPGTHLIDLYPVIYKGREQLPRVFCVPHLSYRDDHPQRAVPAIRLAIQVVA